MGLVEVGDITLKQAAERKTQGISSCKDLFPMIKMRDLRSFSPQRRRDEDNRVIKSPSDFM